MDKFHDRMTKVIRYMELGPEGEPEGEHYFYEEAHELILDAADCAPRGFQERVFDIEQDRSCAEAVEELKRILKEVTE